MKLEIKKMHPSKVRECLPTYGLLEKKFDHCIIGSSEEKLGVYADRKMIIAQFWEILLKMRKRYPNYNDRQECLRLARVDIKDLCETSQISYYLGVQQPIICDDREYLKKRYKKQKLNTWDTFNFDATYPGFLYGIPY